MKWRSAKRKNWPGWTALWQLRIPISSRAEVGLLRIRLGFPSGARQACQYNTDCIRQRQTEEISAFRAAGVPISPFDSSSSQQPVDSQYDAATELRQCVNSKDPNERIDHCSRIIGQSRGVAALTTAHNTRGLALVEVGRFVEAVQDFTFVIRYEPRVAVSLDILVGSDWFSVQAAGDSVLLRGARGGSALGPYAAATWDESIDSLVARGGLERRKRRTRRPGLDGHGRRWAASCLSEVWRAVQFAPQHLLTNASGSVRSRSASHCSSPPRALEVSQPEV
jgi:hypothetical protein